MLIFFISKTLLFTNHIHGVYSAMSQPSENLNFEIATLCFGIA